MTALAPAHAATTITIALLELSDSFTRLWPALTEEFGVAINRVRELQDWAAARADLRVAAVGGAELEFLEVMAALGCDERFPVVAIGADPDHRTAIAMLKAGAAEYFALPGDLSLVRALIRGLTEVGSADLVIPAQPRVLLPLPAPDADVPFPATMREITRGAAMAMVGLCCGNKSEAARRLAISRTRLLRLLDPASAVSG